MKAKLRIRKMFNVSIIQIENHEHYMNRKAIFHNYDGTFYLVEIVQTSTTVATVQYKNLELQKTLWGRLSVEADK